jgi:hypothetical protein
MSNPPHNFTKDHTWFNTIEHFGCFCKFDAGFGSREAGARSQKLKSGKANIKFDKY